MGDNVNSKKKFSVFYLKKKKKLLFLSFIREYEGTQDLDLKKHAILETTNSVQINTLIGFLRSKEDIISNISIKQKEIFYSWPDSIFDYEIIIDEIIKYSPDIILISHIDLDYMALLVFQNSIKSKLPNTIWIVGGYSITSNPNLIKHRIFNFGILSHGEVPLYLLLKYLIRRDISLSKIPNLVYLDQKNEVKNNDLYIFPEEESNVRLSFDEFNISHYKKISWQIPSISEMRYLMTWFSRGCLYNCSFCLNKNMNKNNIIFRKEENIIDEILEMKNRFDVNYIFFADEDFLTNLDKSNNLIELFKKTFGGSVHFTFMTTVDSLIRANEIGLLADIKKAGCEEIQIGVESGCEDILGRMRKNQNIEDIYRAFEYVFNNGMMSSAMIVLGHPGETWDTLHSTYEFIHKLKPDRLSAFFSIPFRGTQLFKEEYSEIPLHFFNTDFPLIPIKEIEVNHLLNKVKSDKYSYEEIFKNNQIEFSLSQKYLEYYKKKLLQDYYKSEGFRIKQRNVFNRRVKDYKEDMRILYNAAKEWFDILSNTINDKGFSMEIIEAIIGGDDRINLKENENTQANIR